MLEKFPLLVLKLALVDAFNVFLVFHQVFLHLRSLLTLKLILFHLHFYFVLAQLSLQLDNLIVLLVQLLLHNRGAGIPGMQGRRHVVFRRVLHGDPLR